MKKIVETGFSVYLSTDIGKNENIIEKAVKSGAEYVFTSLNISEEKVNKISELEKIIEFCSEKNLNLIVDINSTTKNLINVNAENVYLRIDDGLTLDEILKLSEKNKIVLNASMITEENLDYFQKKGIDFSKVLSLHNFYPKRFTGISREYLQKQNLKYKKYGIKTMAFVKGDELRGPVYEGLPTVEKHRNKRFLTSCLDLLLLDTDIVLVGDIDISDKNMKDFKYLNKGIVPLRNFNNILTDRVFKDRIDFSEYIIRAVVDVNIGESRKSFCEYITKELEKNRINLKEISCNGPIKKGDILVSNEKYLRYEGELEIALQDLGIDEKRCVVSKIIDEDMELLDYVRVVDRFLFEKSDKK